MAFQCKYDLDQRPDRDLVNIYQESYRLIQGAFGSAYSIPLDSDGLPDAVQYYLMYASALIHGAADASLTLRLHNLGREARFLGRQIFEYWARSGYYVNNPVEAKALLLSTPFTESEILDELGYSKTADRYANLQRACQEVRSRYPEFSVYREPKLRKIIGTKNDPVATRFYAFLYRVPSQTMHGAGAGAGAVMSEDGISFDSRETNPNIGLHVEARIVLWFLLLINNCLNLHVGDYVENLEKRLDAVRTRLGESFGNTSSSDGSVTDG